VAGAGRKGKNRKESQDLHPPGLLDEHKQSGGVGEGGGDEGDLFSVEVDNGGDESVMGGGGPAGDVGPDTGAQERPVVIDATGSTSAGGGAQQQQQQPPQHQGKENAAQMMALFTRVVGMKMFRRHMLHRHQQYMGGVRVEAFQQILGGADGDMSFYTDESQMAREALRWHPEVDLWLSRWWSTVIKNFDKAEDIDGDGVLDKADQVLSYHEYCSFHTLLWRAYHFSDAGEDLNEDGIPDVDQVSEGQIDAWREEDWLQDSHGDGKLTGVEFKASVFEMVDMHCETDSLAEYLQCLMSQFQKVFVDAGVEVTALRPEREGSGGAVVVDGTAGVDRGEGGGDGDLFSVEVDNGGDESVMGGGGPAGDVGPDTVNINVGRGKMAQRTDDTEDELGSFNTGLISGGSNQAADTPCNAERPKSPSMNPSAPAVTIVRAPAVETADDDGASGASTTPTLPDLFEGRTSPEVQLRSLMSTPDLGSARSALSLTSTNGPYANTGLKNLPPSPIMKVAPSFGAGSELSLSLLLERPQNPPFARQLPERTGGKHYLAPSQALPWKAGKDRRAKGATSLASGSLGHTLERLPVTVESLCFVGHHYPARYEHMSTVTCNAALLLCVALFPVQVVYRTP
jgi:hypothetical protein